MPENTEFTVVRDSDAEGLEVIRHSTAHVMADAVQRLFPGTKVTIGPAIEDGFYYDFDKAGGGSFTEEDLAKIEQTIGELVSKDTPFRREVVSRNDALALFERMGETFKCEIIRAIPEDSSSADRTSTAIDAPATPRARAHNTRILFFQFTATAGEAAAKVGARATSTTSMYARAGGGREP